MKSMIKTDIDSAIETGTVNSTNKLRNRSMHDQNRLAGIMLSVSGAACGIFGAVHNKKFHQVFAVSALVFAAGVVGISQAHADDSNSSDTGDSDSPCDSCPEDESETSGDPVETTEGETPRDEDGCEENGGGSAGVNEEDVGGPLGNHPVNWETGEKWETESDLVVRLPGADFKFTRQYTSDPSKASNPYDTGETLPACVDDSNISANVGFGWGWSNLRAGSGRMNWRSLAPSTAFEATGVDITLYRPARKPKFISGAPGSVILARGPGNQFVGGDFQTEDVDPGAGDPPTACDYLPSSITYGEPGRWTQTFDMTSGIGWITEDEDEDGNKRTYVDTDSDTRALPDQILFNGSSTTWNHTDMVDAWIEIKWDDNRVVRADVYRPSSTGGVITQTVQYYHLVDDTGLEVKYHDGTSYTTLNMPGTSTAVNPSADLGTDGDLVMVVRSTATEPSNSSTQWRRLVTQYRYHDGSSAPTTGDIRLRVEGNVHQLKSVYRPQQIEHMAQIISSSSPTDMTVVNEAIELLESADNTAFDGGSSDLMYEVANKIVTFDPVTDRVEWQFVQSGSCGCGTGGATNGVALSYEWLDWDRDFGGETVNGASMHMREHSVSSFGDWPTTVYRSYLKDIMYLNPGSDEQPYVWNQVLVDGDVPSAATSDAWVNNRKYNSTSRSLTGLGSPSSVSSYTPAIGTTEPSISISTSEGLETLYTYDGENAGSVSHGVSGDTDVVLKRTFVDDGVSSRRRLLEKIERPRVAGTILANEIEVAEFAYGYDSTTTSKLDWMRVREEREIDDENGPAGTAQWVESWEFYDDKGQLILTLDPDGIAVRFEHDAWTGTMTKVTRNYNPTTVGSIPEIRLPTGTGGEPSNPFTGLSANTTGTLVTEYVRDLRGRVTKTTRPGGVESWTARGLDEDAARGGILYYSVISMPHQVVSPGEYAGPASKRLFDAASKTIRSAQWDVEDDATYDPGSDTYANNDLLIDSTELARSVTSHDISGQMTSQERWWDITNDFSATTSYEYDEFGRMTQVTDAEGTLSVYGHDVLNRVISSKAGTTVGNAQTIAEYFYDGVPEASTLAQGVGNGNLTGVKLYDGETTNARITRLYYDDRDRQVASVSPDAPLSLTKYDNLDRPIEGAVYPEQATVPTLASIQTAVDSTTLPSTFGSSSTDRSWHTLTGYSQRGLVWKQQTAIDPASTSPEYLQWLSWYDMEGNELASWGPNAPMTVYEYDEHDRVSHVYVTDRNYAVNNTLTHAVATTVNSDTSGMTTDGDHVLETAEYTYNDSNGGVLELIETKMRVHDSAVRGALSDDEAITSYLGMIYDNALRRSATVNFGTNQSGFNDGTSTAPTLTSFDTLAKLRSATDVLFSWQEYNTRGLVDEVVAIQSGTAAANEIRTKYLYDDLYRTKAVIENYDNATLAWNATEGRYVASGLDITDLSEDRITSFVHDKVNKVTKRVAHLPADPTGEDVQITEYEYGVTSGSTTNVMDSLVATNNLLTRVKYPDESTGEAGASAQYYVDYAYNRLGELRGVTDQNTTIRAFERDEQGRVLADIVDTVGSYLVNSVSRNVDGSIRRIGYAYDALGRMVGTTSHTTTADLTSNIRDEVEIGYTPLWQVKTVAQQHDGEVGSSSPTVEYVYTNADANGAAENYSRLTQLRYPEDEGQTTARDTVQYAYSTGIDDRISRVSKLEVLGLNGANTGGSPILADLINYERIGLGLISKSTIGVGASWDVVLDRTVKHDGSSTSGEYPAFDRFGRVISHMWVRDDFSTHATVSDLSNQPAYMEVTHSYDRSSNRTTYDDDRQGAKLPDRERAFTYDRLNRLTEELRTPIPVGSTYTSQHMSHQWTLDMLGNWDDKVSDADHDGDFTDSHGTNYKDDRDHNMANEIESGLQYDQRLFSSGTTPTFYDHLYDDNGNMTDERSGKSLPAPGTLMAGQLHTYDAWNRLVKTEYAPLTGSNTTISENTYNGLGWRTTRSFDEAQGVYNGLDQKRVYSYGADWRMLEERIDTNVDVNSDSTGGSDDDVDWIGQQFWGIRYIDDAVGKRVDRDGDGDFIDADCTYWYQLTDTQFSVGVVLDDVGNVYERIEYDAYGVARHRFGGDANGNGQYDFFDITGFYGTGAYTISDTTNYHADLDLNCDGSINVFDVGSSPSAIPDGWISDPSSTDGPDNSIGYAGYVFNHEREDYTVRFRNYNPELGRWMQRDPIGYRGGKNMYEYVSGRVLIALDPFGLISNQERGCNILDSLEKNCGISKDEGHSLAMAFGNIAASEGGEAALESMAAAAGESAEAFNRQAEAAFDRWKSSNSNYRHQHSQSTGLINRNLDNASRAGRFSRVTGAAGKGLGFYGTGSAVAELATSETGYDAVSNSFKMANDIVGYFGPIGFGISLSVDILAAIGEEIIDSSVSEPARRNASAGKARSCRLGLGALARISASGEFDPGCCEKESE